MHSNYLRSTLRTTVIFSNPQFPPYREITGSWGYNISRPDKFDNYKLDLNQHYPFREVKIKIQKKIDNKTKIRTTVTTTTIFAVPPSSLVMR